MFTAEKLRKRKSFGIWFFDYLNRSYFIHKIRKDIREANFHGRTCSCTYCSDEMDLTQTMKSVQNYFVKRGFKVEVVRCECLDSYKVRVNWAEEGTEDGKETTEEDY